jgi:hypothetical protein
MLKFIIVAISVFFSGYFIPKGFSQNTENRETHLTIYTQDLGVVNEKRKVSLPEGISTLTFEDIPTQIVSNSIILNFEGEVFQQSLNFDIANLPLFLEKSIGTEISARSPQGQIVKGTLLYYSENSIAMKDDKGDIVLIPDIQNYTIYSPIQIENLTLKPSIAWLVKPKKPGTNTINWTYQTGGISWNANYNAILNDKENKITLQCWANIVNNSGASFVNSEVNLVSGAINVVSPNVYNSPTMKRGYEALSVGSEPATEQLFEYYSFNVPQKVTIKNRESKLIKLFESNNIPIQRTYTFTIYDCYNCQKITDNPSIKISFKNTEKNNLGYPLPKGLVNFYKSTNNKLELIGQSSVSYVPQNEEFQGIIGKAFDIVVESQMIESQRISDRVIQKTIKVNIRNHKKENIVLEIIFSGSGFVELIKSTIKPTSTQSSLLTFEIPANSNETNELTFTVRITN